MTLLVYDIQLLIIIILYVFPSFRKKSNPFSFLNDLKSIL